MSQQVTDKAVLMEMQKGLKPGQMAILKFTADWCGPCKGIKPICDEYVAKLPKDIFFFEIDIEESIELYTFLKSKRMLNGIPALLAYYSGEKDPFYVPDDSQLGGDKVKVKEFFERCIKYVSN